MLGTRGRFVQCHHGAGRIMDLGNLPPFTTLWAGGALTLAALEKLDYVSQYQLFYSNRLVFHSGQYWRLLTSFIYLGSFDVSFMIQLIIFMQYPYMLESQVYGVTRRANFTWLLLISSTLLLIVSSLISMPFPSFGLTYVLMYIWCRKHRHIRMFILGLVVISAPYHPFVYTAMTWGMKGFGLQVFHELALIGVGHLSM